MGAGRHFILITQYNTTQFLIEIVWMVCLFDKSAFQSPTTPTYFSGLDLKKMVANQPSLIEEINCMYHSFNIHFLIKIWKDHI